VKTNGEMHYQWRAVDHEGEIGQQSNCPTTCEGHRHPAEIARHLRIYGTGGRVQTPVSSSLRYSIEEQEVRIFDMALLDRSRKSYPACLTANMRLSEYRRVRALPRPFRCAVLVLALASCSEEVRTSGAELPQTPPTSAQDPRAANYEGNAYQVAQGGRYFTWYGAVRVVRQLLAIGMTRRSRAKPASPFRCFNSSPEVIRLVVMMYVRFPLSLRNVEDLLFERGIDICHETVRHWWNRFGPMFAGDIRRQRVSRMRGFRHWRWHLDEMYVKLNGEMVYLWRAVDHEGEILESYITRTRDKDAALRFMKKALKRHGSPEAITTDGLRSYRAAMTKLGNEAKQEVGRWANNRVENSHLSFRRRERAMLRFRRMKSLQKFVSVHANVHNHFNLERHLVDRQTYKARRSAALAEWQILAS
jgi:putative transposase